MSYLPYKWLSKAKILWNAHHIFWESVMRSVDYFWNQHLYSKYDAGRCNKYYHVHISINLCLHSPCSFPLLCVWLLTSLRSTILLFWMTLLNVSAEWFITTINYSNWVMWIIEQCSYWLKTYWKNSIWSYKYTSKTYNVFIVDGKVFKCICVLQKKLGDEMLSEKIHPVRSWSFHFDQLLHLHAESRIGTPQGNSCTIKILKGIVHQKKKKQTNQSVIIYSLMSLTYVIPNLTFFLMLTTRRRMSSNRQINWIPVMFRRKKDHPTGLEWHKAEFPFKTYSESLLKNGLICCMSVVHYSCVPNDAVYTMCTQLCSVWIL